MARKTLAAVERGASGVTIGAYAAVLQVLQLEGGLDLLAADDALGRALQDKTATRTRARRRAPVDAPAQPDATAPEPPPATTTGISTDALLDVLRANDPAK